MKYIVWIKENGKWVEQGDGPMGPKTAERVAKEIQQDFGITTRVLPVGLQPINDIQDNNECERPTTKGAAE